MLPQTIRQCTCSEEARCSAEMRSQATQCLGPCWNEFAGVSQDPQKVKECFISNKNYMDSFLGCFEQNLRGCSLQSTSRKIQKIDLASYFQQIVSRFNRTRNSLIESLTPIRRILDSSRNFAQCVNNCFLQKNSGGFCFDKIGCQPLITDISAQRSLRRCTKKLNWKQEAGRLCDCVVNAGMISQTMRQSIRFSISCSTRNHVNAICNHLIYQDFCDQTGLFEIAFSNCPASFFESTATVVKSVVVQATT